MKNEWLKFIEKIEINRKKKTLTFAVMSKCSDCEFATDNKKSFSNRERI